MANEITIIVGAKDNTGPALTSAEQKTRKLAESTKAAGDTYAKSEKQAAGFGASLKRVGEVAAGVLVADMAQAGARKAMALMRETVKAASDLGESVNAVNKVFGEASEQVQAWGRENANAIGLSTRAFNQMATPLGSMLKNQGLQLDEVTDHTIKLTQRAADMASVFNTDVTSALAAIQAGLRGEQDPLERYGVSLSAVAVEARALTDTHKTSAAQLTNQEKAVARLNLIYEQTEDTAGDFRDTSDGLANAQRIATATMEEAQAKIGAAFIPIMAKAAELTGQLATGVTSLPQPVVIATAAVLGLGAAAALLAPRALATKEALDRMASSDSALQRSMSRTATVAGKVAAGLGAVAAGAVAANAILGGDGVRVQVDALADSLTKLGQGAEVAGEGARVFGDDLGNLKYDLGTLGSGFWAEFGNGIAGVVETFGDFGADQSLTKAKERIAGIDAALASLVQQGKAEEAAAAFEFLAEQARDAGISVDDLKTGLPQYSGAVQTATGKTEDLGKVTGTTADRIKEFRDALDKFRGTTLALEEAEDDAANAVANLAEQIKEQKKEHEAGAASLEGNTQAARDNREAVRDLVDKYADLIDKYRAAGKPTDKLIQDLENQLVAMGLSRNMVQKYIADLKALTAAIAAIPSSKTVTVQVRTTGARYLVEGGTADILGFSHGGIATGGYSTAATGGARGGWTMTGEHGPELVRLPFGSSVTPAGTTREMLSGGGGMWVAPINYTPSGNGLWDKFFEDFREQVQGRGGTLAVVGVRG